MKDILRKKLEIIQNFINLQEYELINFVKKFNLRYQNFTKF